MSTSNSVKQYVKAPSSKKKIQKNSGPMVKIPVKKDRFVIPESFLTSLDEYSDGGYVLIMSSPHGEPEVYAAFDDSVTGMGLCKFGKQYFKRVGKAFNKTIKHHADVYLD